MAATLPMRASIRSTACRGPGWEAGARRNWPPARRRHGRATPSAATPPPGPHPTPPPPRLPDLVRPAVQGPVQRPHSPRHRGVHVHPGGRQVAGGGGGAVHLVLGVQGEQNVERAGEAGVRAVRGRGARVQHVQEILRIPQPLVGAGGPAAGRAVVGERRDGRHLGHEARNLLVLHLARLVHALPRQGGVLLGVAGGQGAQGCRGLGRGGVGRVCERATAGERPGGGHGRRPHDSSPAPAHPNPSAHSHPSARCPWDGRRAAGRRRRRARAGAAQSGAPAPPPSPPGRRRRAGGRR